MPPKPQSISKSPISAGTPLVQNDGDANTKSPASVQKSTPLQQQVKIVRGTGNVNSINTVTTPGVSLVRVQNTQSKSCINTTPANTVSRGASKPQQIVMVMSPSTNKGEGGKVTFTTTQTVTLAQGQKTYTAAELNQIIQLSQQGTALKIVSMANQGSDASSSGGIKLVQRQGNGQVIIKMVTSSQSALATTTTASNRTQTKTVDITKRKVEQTTKTIADSSISSTVSVPSADTTSNIAPAPAITTTTAVIATGNVSSTTNTPAGSIVDAAAANSLTTSTDVTKSLTEASISTSTTPTVTTTNTLTSSQMTKLDDVVANTKDLPSTTSSEPGPSLDKKQQCGNVSENEDASKMSITMAVTPVVSSTSTSGCLSKTTENSEKKLNTPDSTTPITNAVNMSSVDNSLTQNTITSTNKPNLVSTSSDLRRIATLATNTKVTTPTAVVSQPVSLGGVTSQQSTTGTTSSITRDLAPPASTANNVNKVKSTVKTVS